MQATDTEKRDAQKNVFFIRQPILDAQRRIWGYELLGGELKQGFYEVFPGRQSVSGLASSAFITLQEAMERGKKVTVAFDPIGVLEGLPYAIPASNGVVRLSQEAFDLQGITETLQSLRNEGYLVAMDLNAEAPPQPESCHLVDILAINFSDARTDGQIERAKACEKLVLIRGVKTQEHFETAREMGFDLFQGAFFKEAQPVAGRKLSSNEVSRLNLFKLMEAEEPDFKALAKAISTDVTISFRLLSYLNSAYFGLKQKIASIDQAIMLLGWVKLKTWLRAVLLADMAGQGDCPRELATLSLQRARFLELLSTEYDWWGFNPATLFLVGMFSLVDAILGMRMAEVVELLPLDAKLKSALRRDPNSEYNPIFELMQLLEEGDLDGLASLAQKLGLDLNLVKDFFAQARDTAGAFFSVKA